MDYKLMNELLRSLGISPSDVVVTGVDSVEINIELTYEQLEERIAAYMIKDTQMTHDLVAKLPVKKPSVMPSAEEFKGFKQGELFDPYGLTKMYPVDIPLAFVDYMKTLSNIGSGVDYEKIAKDLKEVAKQWPDNVVYCNFREGYMETPNRRRRSLRRKSTLDNNNPLR